MATTPLDILGVGSVAVDDLLYVAAYPPADTKARVLRRERQCGGLTGTALVAAARSGARCGYAGVVGTDELSDAIARQEARMRYAAAAALKATQPGGQAGIPTRGEVEALLSEQE